MPTTILVTGSTDGLGRALTQQLAAEGVRVLAHGRSQEKLDDLVAQTPGDVVPLLADLASLPTVDRLADQVLAWTDRLDVLVSNAGVGFGPNAGHGAPREVSEDGIELRLAVNHLAGYHLVRRLLPLLVASAPARVVMIASVGQEAIDFDDPLLETAYDGMSAYRRAKVAEIMTTFDLAEQLAGSGVTVNALHPASLMGTTMVADAGLAPQSTLAEGLEATLRLVQDPALDGVTGRYFDGLEESTALPQAYDPEARARLRVLSDRLVADALA